MNKQKKIPTVRFKGFTNDWEQRKLGDNTNTITKGTTPHDKSNKGSINFVKVESIQNNTIRPTMHIHQEENDGRLARSKLKTNDILFSIAGTLGRTAIVSSDILPANTNQALAIIRGYTYNPIFLINYLSGKAIKSFIKHNPTIGAQPNLSLRQVRSFIITAPENEIEQRKIGLLLKQVDNAITLQQRKLDLLKQLKKGLLQKMFADKGSKRPILRFSGFTDDWKQCKLGDISEKTYSGLSGKSKEDFGHGHARYITYLNVHDNAVADPEGIDKVEIDSKQNNVIQGDLLFTVSSEVPEEVALNSVWPIDSKNIYLNSFCFGLRPLSNKINSFFLTYYLRSPKMRKAVYPLAQGISRFNISKKNILKLDINIHKKTEQVAIYRSLKLIEDIIAIQQQKLTKINEIKKSLLQQMFI